MSVTWNINDKSNNISLDTAKTTTTRTGGDRNSVRSTGPIPSGKWYWEIKLTVVGSPGSSGYTPGHGLALSTFDLDSKYLDTNGSYLYTSGYLWPGSSWGSNYYDGDIIGFAFDRDANTLYISLNGVWQESCDPANGTGSAFDSLPADLYLVAHGRYVDSSHYDSETLCADTVDQAYSIPSGYSALGTVPLPANTGDISSTLPLPSSFIGGGGMAAADMPSPTGIVLGGGAIAGTLSSATGQVLSGNHLGYELQAIGGEATGGWWGDIQLDLQAITGSIVEYEINGDLVADLPFITCDFSMTFPTGIITEELPVITGGMRAGGAASASTEAVTGEVVGRVGLLGTVDKSLQAVTGTLLAGGSLSSILQALTYTAAGKTGTLGNTDTVLPSITGTVAGKVEILGTAVTAFPVVRGSIAGVHNPVGEIDALLRGVHGSIVGYKQESGTISNTLPAITAECSGKVENTGTLSGEIVFSGLLTGSQHTRFDDYIIRYRRP